MIAALLCLLEGYGLYLFWRKVIYKPTVVQLIWDAELEGQIAEKMGREQWRKGNWGCFMENCPACEKVCDAQFPASCKAPPRLQALGTTPIRAV
jgi:hypothetical protein